MVTTINRDVELDPRAGTATCHPFCSALGEALGIHNVLCDRFVERERETAARIARDVEGFTVVEGGRS